MHTLVVSEHQKQPPVNLTAVHHQRHSVDQVVCLPTPRNKEKELLILNFTLQRVKHMSITDNTVV